MSLKISIVTPSFNQGEFLEACIQSVLNQQYPHLEYVVMDGGSRDKSPAIIQKYAKQLHDFRIGPDTSQYHALNKGFALTRGNKADIMGWLNSDDIYMPWSFSIISEIFSKFPQVEWLSTIFPILWNQKGIPCRTIERDKFSVAEFYAGRNCGINHLQQESTFWRRSLWERAGGKISTKYSLAGDFELWARFFQHAHCYGVTTILGGFREHDRQKTYKHMLKYINEAKLILGHFRGRLPHGYLRRHGLISTLARILGKRDLFRSRNWLAPNSFIVFDRQNGWKIYGPSI